MNGSIIKNEIVVQIASRALHIANIEQSSSTMGRGTKLTSDQIAVVKALHNEKKSVRKIAEAIKKSPTAVQNCIKRVGSNVRRKKLGRPSTITPQFRRAIMRSVVRDPEERVTASRLLTRYQPKVGLRRVQQLMQEAEHLRWTRITSAPRLTEDHKKARLSWAKAQLMKAPSK